MTNSASLTRTKTIKILTLNFLTLYLGYIVEYLLVFIFIIYVARKLGAEQYGILRFAQSLNQLFFIISDFGLGMFLIREIARRRDDKELIARYVSSALVLKFLLALVVLFFIWFTIKALNLRPPTTNVVFLICIAMIISSFSFFFQGIFQGLEKMFPVGVSRFLSALTLCITGLYLLTRGADVVLIAYVYTISNTIAFAFCILTYFLFFRLSLRLFSLSFIKNLARATLPFALFGFFATVYFHIDVVMLHQLRNETEVGLYGVASRLIITVLFLAQAFMDALYPRMSRLYQEEPQRLVKYFHLALWAMYLIAAPATVGLCLTARDAILFFFGREYVASATVLMPLSGLIFLRFLGSVPAVLLTATNRQTLRNYLVIVASFLSIILNYFLISIYGFIGAGITALIVNFLILTAYLLITTNLGFSPLSIFPLLFRPTIATLIMAMVILLLAQTHFIWEFIIGIFVYCAVLFILRTFTTEEINLIKELFATFTPFARWKDEEQRPQLTNS